MENAVDLILSLLLIYTVKLIVKAFSGSGTSGGGSSEGGDTPGGTKPGETKPGETKPGSEGGETGGTGDTSGGQGSQVDVGSGIDSSLLDELASSGVKYNPDEVIMVTKNLDGKLMWLEKGNGKAGLTHILEKHADNFAARGVSDIPNLLKRVLSTKPIKTGSNAKGLYADYVFNGNKYRVAYGTNGFVVSFYPID